MSLGVTMDWEAIFEDPETGLIPLITRAQSPEILRQNSHVAFRELLKRKNDDLKLKEFIAALDKIVPKDALANDLDLMRTDVAKLLRQIKKQRLRKAAEYRVSKYAEKDGERRSTAARPLQPASLWKQILFNWRTALAFAAAAAAIAAVIVNVDSAYDSRKREAQGLAAARWVQNYVHNHLQLTSLDIKAVRVSGDSVIELDINISESRDVALFNALKSAPRTTRGEILDIVCPPPRSGISKILDQGWTLLVVIRSQSKKITEGNCRYRRDKS